MKKHRYISIGKTGIIFLGNKRADASFYQMTAEERTQLANEMITRWHKFKLVCSVCNQFCKRDYMTSYCSGFSDVYYFHNKCKEQFDKMKEEGKIIYRRNTNYDEGYGE